MEERQNARAGNWGDSRENPPTSGIVLHDSYKENKKSGIKGSGIGARSCSCFHSDAPVAILKARRLGVSVAHSVDSTTAVNLGHRNRMRAVLKQTGCTDGDEMFMPPSRKLAAGSKTGATVAERLDCSPPAKANRVQSLTGSLRIFASGNRAGRCRWSAVFLGISRFPRPFTPTLVHTHLTSPSSVLKTSMLNEVRSVCMKCYGIIPIESEVLLKSRMEPSPVVPFAVGCKSASRVINEMSDLVSLVLLLRVCSHRTSGTQLAEFMLTRTLRLLLPPRDASSSCIVQCQCVPGEARPTRTLPIDDTMMNKNSSGQCKGHFFFFVVRPTDWTQRKSTLAGKQHLKSSGTARIRNAVTESHSSIRWQGPIATLRVSKLKMYSPVLLATQQRNASTIVSECVWEFWSAQPGHLQPVGAQSLPKDTSANRGREYFEARCRKLCCHPRNGDGKPLEGRVKNKSRHSRSQLKPRIRRANCRIELPRFLLK
ncbi:hypothetical protein PR048_031645, partial [Dryococelus australis]